MPAASGMSMPPTNAPVGAGKTSGGPAGAGKTGGGPVQAPSPVAAAMIQPKTPTAPTPTSTNTRPPNPANFGINNSSGGFLI